MVKLVESSQSSWFGQKRRWLHRSSVLPLLAWLVIGVAASSMAQETAIDFFPESSVAVVEVKHPDALIAKIAEHRLIKTAWEMPQVERMLATPQAAMAQLGLKLLEGQLGEPILETIKENTSGGLWVGVDLPTQGVVMVFRAKEEDRLKRVAGKVLKFAASAAQQGGNDVPFKKTKYRDAAAAEFDKAIIARYKNWFVVCNKKELAKQVVDRMIDGEPSGLSSKAWYQKAKRQNEAADIIAAVDLAQLRGVAKNGAVFSGQTDNPGIELLFGGVLDLLKHSPAMYASLEFSNDLAISVEAPFDESWTNESREYFYGQQMSGKAPTLLQPENTIAGVTSYRDVGQWWLAKEELYAENVIAQLAQTDSQLSTIFSGMDFGEDVLGALQPGVQILVTENKYKTEHEPDVKLPSFALVGKLKDPKRLNRKLKIAFQSVIGFANINLGMNGQPQLDVETETLGTSKLTSASYFVEEGAEEGLVLFNFAPTIAFEGENLVLASTRELAVEICELLKAKAKPTPNRQESSNTSVHISGPMLTRILELNRESLIAQNMLEEGNDRDEAETQIELVLSVLDLFKDAGLDYQIGSEEMRLDLNIRFEK